MKVERLVVVGASLAGLRAVEAARKSGFEGGITLIGAERHLPYDRPPLSKEFLDATEPGVDV
jgi:NADPH-dependent 2,4-dienoyl-CoA reductase/sulfur reductase-like enzyme